MIIYYFYGNFFTEIFYKFIISINYLFEIFSVINQYEYFVSINSINKSLLKFYYSSFTQ